MVIYYSCMAKAKAKTKSPKLKKFYSTRQKIAIEKLSHLVANREGNEKVTMAKILLEAGYSPEYARSPSKLLKSKNFQELLNENLPDDLLTKVHNDALEAKNVDSFVFPLALENDEIKELITGWGFKLTKISTGQTNKRAYYAHPDHKIRLDAVKEAYKIKNKYPAEKHQHEITAVKIVKYGE